MEFIAQRDWDEHITLFLLTYQTTQHNTTRPTPSLIIVGRDYLLPCDLRFDQEETRTAASNNYIHGVKKRVEGICKLVQGNIQPVIGWRLYDIYDIRVNTTGWTTLGGVKGIPPNCKPRRKSLMPLKRELTVCFIE